MLRIAAGLDSVPASNNAARLETTRPIDCEASLISEQFDRSRADRSIAPRGRGATKLVPRRVRFAAVTADRARPATCDLGYDDRSSMRVPRAAHIAPPEEFPQAPEIRVAQPLSVTPRDRASLPLTGLPNITMKRSCA